MTTIPSPDAVPAPFTEDAILGQIVGTDPDVLLYYRKLLADLHAACAASAARGYPSMTITGFGAVYAMSYYYTIQGKSPRLFQPAAGWVGLFIESGEGFDINYSAPDRELYVKQGLTWEAAISQYALFKEKLIQMNATR